MIKPVHPAVLLMALSAFWTLAHAQAQNVYRCGGSYSNTPCPGATVVPTDDPRSSAQRAQTDAATKRDARSAQVLETERLKQEAKPALTTVLDPGAASGAVTPPADKLVSKTRLKKPELFTAVAPRKPGETTAKKKKRKKKDAAA